MEAPRHRMVLVEEREGRKLLFCNHCKFLVWNKKSTVVAHLGLCFPDKTAQRDAVVADLENNGRLSDGSVSYVEWWSGLQFQRPVAPFAFLPSQKMTGCPDCSYVVGAATSMAKHQREKHNRHSVRTEMAEAQELGTGEKVKYVRVTQATTIQKAPPLGSLLERCRDGNRAAYVDRITHNSMRDEPNAMLERLKFDRHLRNYEPLPLVDWTTSAGAGEEQVLELTKHMLDVATRARDRLQTAPHPVLTQLNRRRETTPAGTEFNVRIVDKTMRNYASTWKKLYRYMYHILAAWKDGAEEEGGVTTTATTAAARAGPPTKLTAAQKEAFEAAMETNWESGTTEEKDAVVTGLVEALTRHELRGDAFESVLLSGVAVLAIDEQGG